MTITNVRSKAAEVVETATTTTTTQLTVEQAKAYKEQIDNIIQNQFKQAEAYSTYLSTGENAKRYNLEAELKGIAAELDIYIKTGVYPTGLDGTVASTTGVVAPVFPDWEDATDGWYTFDANSVATKQSSEMVESDEDIVGDGYAGTITVDKMAPTYDSNGELVKTNLWFIMTSEMESITGKNLGNDIVVTVVYNDGRDDELYVIKNGAIRSDMQVGVNALKVEGQGVTIDFSKVAIVDQTTGEKGGVLLIGSKQDDIITGSAGVDELHGAGGSDTLDGMGDSDKVYGYGREEVVSSFGSETMGTDGEDTIYDIHGNDIQNSDTIYGGAGTDTLVRGQTDGSVQAAHEMEENLTLPAANPDDIAPWFSETNGWDVTTNNNELVLAKNSSDASSIVMDVDDGYMVSSSMNGKDMVMTVMYPGEDGGEPTYYRVVIKNYASQDGSSLTVNKAGFVDMSAVNIGANSVTLNGTDSEGDVLIGPRTIFEDYAIDSETLGTSTVDDADIAEMLSVIGSEEANKDSVWYAVANQLNGCSYNSDGVITIPAGMITNGTLDVPSELGAAAFVQTVDGNTQITIVSNEGLTPASVVIKIAGPVPANFSVTVNATKSDVYYVGASTGVTINGAEGKDLVAGYKYGTNFDDPDDDSTELNIPTPVDHIPTESADTTEDLNDKIAAAASFTALDQYQVIVDDLDDETDKTELQETLNDRRKELIMNEISEATTEAELNALSSQVAKLNSNGVDTTSLENEIEEAIEAVKNA